LLDGSCHLQLLLDALALAYLLREVFPNRNNIKRAPLLGDLASRYAVDVDAFNCVFLPGRR
jgi:hypothetical protein